MSDRESTDLRGAAHFARDDDAYDERPSPDEYAMDCPRGGICSAPAVCTTGRCVDGERRR